MFIFEIEHLSWQAFSKHLNIKSHSKQLKSNMDETNADNPLHAIQIEIYRVELFVSHIGWQHTICLLIKGLWPSILDIGV